MTPVDSASNFHAKHHACPDPARWRARIVARSLKDDNDCWIWQGKPWDGYGKFSWGKRDACKAHRAAYMAFVGDIPTDYVIDHLCRVKMCVNPEHLEAVTNAENIARGDLTMHRGDKNRGRTHCKHGHEFTSENTRVDKRTGQRYCRSCAQATARRTYERRKATGYYNRSA